MLEAALYTVLGFAVASLLALMVAPAVWRQAVRITRNRIEASVPLTLNEIQADKDQLRAEFAMSTRRLEMNLDKLREQAATQEIEVNRKRDELSLAASRLEEREAELDAATAEGKRLAAELKAREETLAKTADNLATASATLETQARQLDDYETALKVATADVDAHRSELAARDRRLADLEPARSDLDRERERTERLQGTLETARARIADLEAIADRNADDMGRIAAHDDNTTALHEVRENEVVDLRVENERLAAELARTRTELETQKVELAAARLAGGDGYGSGRSDNAVVRERLNDLAARVTLVAAEMEGAGGPVERILRESPEPPRFPSQAYDTPDGNPPESLADRIRALKALAEKE